MYTGPAYINITDTNLTDAGTPVAVELAHHISIGQVIILGPPTAVNSNSVLVSGGAVTAGTGLSVNVTSGTARNRLTGAITTGNAGTNVALASNTSGLTRIDLVAWNATGTVAVVTGTPASTPVAPAIPAGYTPLATATVVNGATAPSGLSPYPAA